MTTPELPPLPETPCTECGMVCRPTEYHPYAACLMFKACRDGATVRANLEAVRADALEDAAKVCEQVDAETGECPELAQYCVDAIRSMAAQKGTA